MHDAIVDAGSIRRSPHLERRSRPRNRVSCKLRAASPASRESIIGSLLYVCDASSVVTPRYVSNHGISSSNAHARIFLGCGVKD